MRRSYSEVNSRGSAYDYGSIMHYGDTFFVRDDCTDCKSLRVTNDVVYTKQGRPTMGQENGLSLYDILQANNLYSCPLPGVHTMVYCQAPSQSMLNMEKIYQIGTIIYGT